MNNNQSFTTQLRQANIRPTQQRLGLAGLLFQNGPRHFTAESLHEEALAANMNVSLATVYNTLHQFTKAKLIREVGWFAGRLVFDSNVAPHYHFVLPEGDKLRDIAKEQIMFSQLPEAPPGTEIDRIEVTVHLKKSA
ncbi:MAG: iron response transcriptional regulator IrrA [Dongiaceae bacterium]